jgi:hypothetical protein
MPYVYLDPADYTVGKAISFEEYAQLVENANQAYSGATAHGECFFTRTAATTAGAFPTVSGSAPGPYTFVVPAGVTLIEMSATGATGAPGAVGSSGTSGGSTSITGSTSGNLATITGSGGGGAAITVLTGGAGGVASGSAPRKGNGTAGGDGYNDGVEGRGGNAGLSALVPVNLGVILYQGQRGEDLGPSASSGGGGSGGEGVAAGMVSVTPGETITVTVGAGGTNGYAPENGANGTVYIRF